MELHGVLFRMPDDIGGHFCFQDAQFLGDEHCKDCYHSRSYIEDCHDRGQNPTIGDSPICDYGTHEWEQTSGWTVEGTHILKSRDHLTIFDPADQSRIVWQGSLSLTRAGNQRGVDRAVWRKYFDKKYPAQLIPRQ